METTARTVAKAGTWQTLGLLVMTMITYVVTGSLLEGGVVAVASMIIGAVFYVVHEKIWARVAWGRNS